MRVRAAHEGDLAAVAEVYNEGIAGRQATFETEPRTADHMTAWLDDGLPFVVAVDERDDVLGFARVSAYSDRCVYAGVGEYAVYVAGHARAGGIGRRLMDALCAAAEERGFYKLTSRMFTANTASRSLARASGFREVGVQLCHGRIDGEWRDCVLVERLLGAAARHQAARTRSTIDRR